MNRTHSAAWRTDTVMIPILEGQVLTENRARWSRRWARVRRSQFAADLRRGGRVAARAFALFLLFAIPAFAGLITAIETGLAR